jgi:hypothetical protein
MMDSFCIPWSCLESPIKKPDLEKPQTKPQKSFVQALNNVCDIPTSQLPQACVKGDRLVISIPEEDYLGGLDVCKHNLHGRVVWPKGATPLTVLALKSKLASIWKDLSKWGVMSLGKGFYEFSFSSLEDVRRVRSVTSWNLSPGTLRLFAWTKDFNPRLQQNQSAQVWVRFYGLAQEYWRPNIIFAIGSSLGTPICTDDVTAKPQFERTFGHYARVLIDMDLSQTLRDKVLVERIGFAFFIEIEYENLPEYCNHFKLIGHCIANCNRINPQEDNVKEKEQKGKKKIDKEIKKNYVQTKDGRVEQNKSTEVINVEESNDKVDDNIVEDPSNNSKFVSSATKKTDTVDVDDKIEAPSKVVSQQNMFAALVNDVDTLDSPELPLIVTQNQNKDNSNSEFVHDTQRTDDELEEVESADIAKCRNKKNSEFLSQSWANMTEDEEAEGILLREPVLTPVPFKMVQARSRKNSPKKQSAKLSKPYGTRSGVGNSKPSK